MQKSGRLFNRCCLPGSDTQVYKVLVSKRIPLEETSHFWQVLIRMLSERLDEKGKPLSVNKLGQRIGKSTAAMAKWRTGEALPKLETRKAIAKALARPVSDLLFDQEDEAQAPGVNADPGTPDPWRQAVDSYLATTRGQTTPIAVADQMRSSSNSLRAAGITKPTDDNMHSWREMLERQFLAASSRGRAVAAVTMTGVRLSDTDSKK